MLHRFSGVTVRRTLDRSHAAVPEHAHDWPLLSLFVIGAYANRSELGEEFITGPSAVLYAAGAAHSNTASAEGFEQIEIEFDPAWFRDGRLPAGPVSRWMGGRSGAAARALARACGQELTEERLRTGLQRFFGAVRLESKTRRPAWLGDVTRRLKDDPSLRVSALARTAGLHPSWLGTAYRQAAGEGLMDAAARYRVERATCLLRETGRTFADIAAETGFCDQSHMIRSFRRTLGRLPTEVREDRRLFRQF